jgi:NAD(P)-dependent dehydrogenase (short-subunit alcohol dehydrogenase family)
VNFCGAAATLTALAPRMRAEKRGHLVGISSLASMGALPGGSAAYCAPKAGLSMLLECLRLDLAPHGVRVSAVHVGFVETEMVASTQFFMPMMLSTGACADHIVTRLPGGPATIDFPWPMAAATRLHGALPRWVRERIARVGARYARL